jgi:tryptophan synthase alpha chain
MNILDESLNRLRKQNRKGIIPYFTAGYPTLETSKKLILETAQEGCDAVEIGIPFSDPLADGKSIQFSSLKALKYGVTMSKIFRLVEEVQRETSIPVVLMSYLNPISRYGLERFLDHGAQKGVTGLITVDSGLPLDNPQSLDLSLHCRKKGIHLIHLAASTTTNKRFRKIEKESTGFIYLVSLLGITGVRKRLSNGLLDFTAKIRQETDKLLYVGFGISTPKQAREAVRHTDGVIVGSALIEIFRKSRSEKEGIKKVGEFIREMKKSIN